MAKRRSKARKPAKKPRKTMNKTMKMAAKSAFKKSALQKSAKGHKRMAKPAKKAGIKAGVKLGKPTHRRARMSAARHRPIMIKTIVIKKGAAKSANPANPFGIGLPEMPFGYSRDSVVNALVLMLILVALVSAGIFYPQTKSPHQAWTAAPVTMHK